MISDLLDYNVEKGKADLFCLLHRIISGPVGKIKGNIFRSTPGVCHSRK